MEELRNDQLEKNSIEDDIEIDIVELLYMLVEKWKIILVAALAGALFMAFYVYVIATPMYEATSKLYVLNARDSAINLSDLQIGSYLTSDYQQIFDAWEVHEMVKTNLGLEFSYTELKDMLTITNPSNTRILHITAQNENAELAAMLANEYAYVAKMYISDTMETDEPKVLSEALTPLIPVSPRKTMCIALGFTAGAFIVCVIAVVKFIFDDRIRTIEDIRNCTGLPTLAVVPKNGAAYTKKL